MRHRYDYHFNARCVSRRCRRRLAVARISRPGLFDLHLCAEHAEMVVALVEQIRGAGRARGEA